ncbi:MAG: NAD-binding protein [Solirubrobacteraceae bacterium]
MARCLIIGCGARGQALSRELRALGNVVRGTTRTPAHVAAIEAAGAEAFVGDPDRLATLFGALDHVSVAYVLLGSVSGSHEQVAALHGDRLDSLVFKMVDTTIRVVIYEAAGTVEPALLAGGERIVERVCEENRMLYSILSADPDDRQGWLDAAVAAMSAAVA